MNDCACYSIKGHYEQFVILLFSIFFYGERKKKQIKSLTKITKKYFYECDYLEQEERDVLVFGDRRWITNLHYSFQDQTNLVSLRFSCIFPV